MAMNKPKNSTKTEWHVYADIKIWLWLSDVQVKIQEINWEETFIPTELLMW
jgi:hypothetical protein